jgi:hypothetical protein
MSELTVSQIIKIILGVLVFIAVVTGMSFFFKDYFLNYIRGLPTNVTKLFMILAA